MVKIYEKEQKIENVCVGFKCDVCKKEVKGENEPIEITTGHFSWGNDSVDSVEHFQVCDLNCFINGIKSDLFEFDDDYDDSYLEFRGTFNGEQINEISRCRR